MAQVLGGGSGTYIYGVLPIPNPATPTGCNTSGKTCSTIYHCGDSSGRTSCSGVSNQNCPCKAGQWAYAQCNYGLSNGNTDGCSCTDPYVLSDTLGSNPSPTPYNYMAGLVSGVTPAISIPPINGKYPHMMVVNGVVPQTGLAISGSSRFADFTDGTYTGAGGWQQSVPCSAGGPGSGGFLVLAYEASWFVTGTAQASNSAADIGRILQFMNSPGWVNVVSDSCFAQNPLQVYTTTTPGDPTAPIAPWWPTYGGAIIPNLYYQIYNYVLAGNNTATNLCGQQANVSCTNGQKTCSNYFANVPQNPCAEFLSNIFGGPPPGSVSPGVPCQNWGLDSAPGRAYTASAAAFCQSVQFTSPDSVGNTGPPECFCQNPNYSSLYNQVTQVNQDLLPVAAIGCWWQPCRDPTGYLPSTSTPPDQTCDEPICAQIVQTTGQGSFTDQGKFSQYMNCSGGNGGGGNNPPGPAFPWKDFIWLAVGFAFLLVIVIFIARSRGQEEEADAKKTDRKK